ncbi:MAG: LPS export ABC transporter periplasmic protein LptC [Paramuribaculum sp.]|nr:LPS export ABC transporter periplasmic protein LptC [Paramuribaculum sp.]
MKNNGDISADNGGKRTASCGLRGAFITVVVAVMALLGCSDEKKEVLQGVVDPERFATMTTTEVSSLISDSGIIKYHITAPLWLVFDEASEPHWRFPKGLFLEKYNDESQQDASIRADSAIYYKNRQLWRLDGYVEIANPQGEKFLTEQLFWDQRQAKVYSDSFIHIERTDRIIEGYGFVSNDRMTKYEVLNVSGIFPSEKFRPGEGTAKRDSLSGDSVSTGGRRVTPRKTPKDSVPRPDVIVSSKTSPAKGGKTLTPGIRPADGGVQRADNPLLFRNNRPDGEALPPRPRPLKALPKKKSD